MILASLEKIFKSYSIKKYSEKLYKKKQLNKCKYTVCQFESMEEFHKEKQRNNYFVIKKSVFYLHNNKLYKILIVRKRKVSG